MILKIIISIFAVLFFTGNANAQLLGEEMIYPNVEREFYPNVKTIKTKSYNGTGGKGFWRIAKFDTMGRVIEKEYYRKRKLLSRQNFVYNSNNDILYEITTFDINDPNRINDTIFFYEYKYQEDKIIYQKLTFYHSKQDSIVMRLIENKADTTLIYQKKTYYFRPKRNVTDIYEEKHTLNYKNGLLISFEKIDESRRATTYLEYYSNRKLKRKKTEREPEEEFVMTGGPGGDDMVYEYKFDISGRIKKLYFIIGKEKYKIATYEYRKK